MKILLFNKQRLCSTTRRSLEETLEELFKTFINPPYARSPEWWLLTELIILLVERLPPESSWHERGKILKAEINFQRSEDDERRAVEIFDEFRRRLPPPRRMDGAHMDQSKLVLGLIMKFCDKNGGWYGRAELLARENIIAACEQSYDWQRHRHIDFVIKLFPSTETERLARVALDRSGGAALGC